MAPHPMLGRKLGNYVLSSLLGQGGMGAVFVGEHKFLGDKVAIKVLHGTYASNPNVTQRFFTEAKATRDINHPGVIKILDFGQAPDGGLYLVMELLEGHSLGAQLRAGPLDEGSTAYIGAAVADALAAAHDKKIVHRDLKPDNIFLAGERVKVLDFGVAKVLSGSKQTGTGMFLGTPRYMSPEQARGAKYVGPHSDIYALGLLLYRMLAGRLPFEAEDPAELIGLHLREKPPKPSRFATISVEMEELILSCLEKLPAGRPENMIAVRDELSRWAKLGRLPVPPPEDPPEPTPGSESEEIPELSLSMVTLGSGEVVSRAGERPPTQARSGGFRWVALGSVLFLAGAAFVGVKIYPRFVTPTTVGPAPTEPTPPAATGAAPPAAPIAPPAQAAAPVKVVVRSTPPGASVELGDKPVGVTPLVLTVVLPQPVLLKLDGYHPAREVLSAPGEAMIKLEREHHAHHGSAKPDTPTPLPAAPTEPTEGLE